MRIHVITMIIGYSQYQRVHATYASVFFYSYEKNTYDVKYVNIVVT